jgi:NO-binding membrane sensor protein with MHYT domain
MYADERTRYLLIGSSVSMGGIAIWCMHYIGNRAIILAQGEAIIQIAYNPEITVASFFVPIIVLLAAFIAVGSNDVVSIIRVAIGGSLAGLAICGMHYLGQASVSNYTCVYQVTNVVGAAVIAVVASITALSVFFILRAAWTSFWWRRALTAVILAGAVSGMHWLASVGTQYRLKQVDLTAGQNLSAESTVVVVIVLVCSLLRHCRYLRLTSTVNCGLLHPTCFYIARSTAEVSGGQSCPACCPRCSYI